MSSARSVGAGYDREAMDLSFQRGLKAGKVIYLDNLKKKCLQDYELHGEHALLEKAFHQLKLYIGTNASKASSVRLADLARFGLSSDIIERVGYIAIQNDSSASPAPHPAGSKSLSAAKPAPSHPLPVVHPVPLQSANSDEYEEDFEEVDEEEYQRSKGNYDPARRIVRRTPLPPPSSSSIDEKDLVTPRVTSHPGNIITTPATSASVAPPNMRLYKPATISESIDRDISPGRARPASKPSSAASSSSSSTPCHPIATSSSTTHLPGADVRISASVPRRGQTIPAWIANREWKLGEKIGAGSFGEVFQAMNNKGKLFAAKKMNMTNQSAELSKLWEEISLMRGLCHKHIVEYIGTFVDTSTCSLYIFQEWVPGGSVAHLLKKFGPLPMNVVRNYTRQILFGLVYLHNKNIVHRDIKGGNVLVDDNGVVKLADFGASTRLSALNSTQETANIQGTPYFMAPEVLANNRYGRKGDIWAVGCTMIQMFTGEPPWKDMNLKGIVQLHFLLSNWNQGPPPCPREDLTEEARECLGKCFQKVPEDRPTAMELLQCRYLRDDELEDSSVAPLEYSLSSTLDNLDDSGVMNNLKQEMARALENQQQHQLQQHLQPQTPMQSAQTPMSYARSRENPYSQPGVAPGSNGAGGNVDTIQEIDKRLMENRNAVRRGSGSSTNPFSTGTPRDGNLEGIAAKLPLGNNFPIPVPGASPVMTPRTMAKDPSFVHASPKGVQSPGKPVSGPSSNPFARGSLPTGDLRRAAGPISSHAEDKFSPAGHQSNVTSPISLSTPRGDEDLRRSLQGIKKKANVRMQMHGDTPTPSSRATPSLVGRASDVNPPAKPLSNSNFPIHASPPHSAEGNLSSQRDSEGLTPEPFDSDSEEIVPLQAERQRIRQEAKISYPIDTTTSLSSPPKARRDPSNRYDTRYFEAKYDDSPQMLLEASNSLGSSKGDKFSREQSVESVEDMTDYYYQEQQQQLQQQQQLLQHQAHSGSSIHSGSSSRREDNQDEVLFSRPSRVKCHEDNIVTMKKSASAADGVGTVNRRVPRLQALEQRDRQGNTSSSSNIAVSKSISARIHRPERLYSTEESSRPYTSKAALGVVPEYRLGKPALSRESTEGEESWRGHGRRAAGDEGSGEWDCLKCGERNHATETYCEKCATMRGALGRRGNDAAIYRL